MAKTKIKIKDPRNIFYRMYNIFENNISLHEVSIDTIGSYAFRYDETISGKLIKVLQSATKTKQKKKKIVLSDFDFQHIRELMKKHPKQGELFAKNTLVSLVSTIDFLFAKIFEYYYTKNPEKLSIENKSISFGDLKDITDISHAQKFLVNREVELLLLQKGFGERLKILKDELDIGVPGGEKNILALRKLAKIRNLIVHNEGRADSDYVRLYGDNQIKEGGIIKIAKEYLITSVALVYLIGSFILQEVQLKLSDGRIKSGEFILNDVIHRLVKQGHYELLRPIYEYAINGKLDDINRKMIIVNYCIALKKQGREKVHIEKVLENEDWSSASHAPEFKFVLAALKGDNERFFKLLGQAIKNKTIGKEELREWDIFSFYKKNSKFKKLQEKAS